MLKYRNADRLVYRLFNCETSGQMFVPRCFDRSPILEMFERAMNNGHRLKYVVIGHLCLVSYLSLAAHLRLSAFAPQVDLDFFHFSPVQLIIFFFHLPTTPTTLPTLLEFQSLKIRRPSNFIVFRTVVRRILKLESCKRVHRVTPLRTENRNTAKLNYNASFSTTN